MMDYTTNRKSTTGIILTFLCTLLLVINDLYVTAQGPPCSPGNKPVSTGKDQTGNNDDAVLMLTDGQITCDGLINIWDFFTGGQTDYQVHFQVWRPDAGGYRLVSENYLDFSSWIQAAPRKKSKTWTVPTQYKIPVQVGDVIGWYNRDSGGAINKNRAFQYNTGGGSATLILDKAPYCSYSPGSYCTWAVGTLASVTADTFSLKASVTAGNPPYFINLGQTVTINPNEPAGTLYYTVRGSFEYNAQDVYNPPLVYSITAGGACTGDYIIDGTAGEVRGHVTGPRACTLTIAASPLGSTLTGTGTLTINIDTNVPPTVDPVVLATPPDSFIVDTTSDTAGQLKHTATCSVACPANTKTTCNLLYSEPENAPFTVGSLTTPGPNLMDTDNRFSSTAEIRDWQGPDTYDLTMACSTQYSTSAPAVLTATFTNLRLPPGSDLPASTSIMETQISGPTIYTVTDTDRSSGRSGGILYSMLAVYPRTSNDWFTVSLTGNVATSATANFDFFVQKTYDVEILVSDNDGLLQADPANLTVELTWVNRPPVLLTPTFTTTIPEKSAVGSPLPGILLDATDRDTQAPIDDWITYVISDVGTPPLGAHLFKANNITSLIYVESIISINTPGVASVTYNMLVLALDSFGAPSTQSTLAVTVTDINDHAPVFSPTYYQGWVWDYDTGPTYVTTVSATDDDAGNNAQILYSILEPEAKEYFEVGAFSGDVSLKQPISYLDYPNITFTVVATDQGVPALNGTATVFVVVNETNMYRPVFEQDYYNVEVRSDLARGESVLQVVADDLDTDAVSSVTYYYLVIQEDFGLLNKTGNVTVARKMSKYHTYVLYLNARDLGYPNEYQSDPAFARIDTYDAGETLVDIHLNIPLQTFLSQQDDFMNELNILLDPWTVKFVKALLEQDITIVTIYAMSQTVAQDDMYSPKVFVNRNDVMRKLRTDKQGSPNEALRGPAFAAFEPIEVQPTYPDWMIDTPGGIATLSILCILAAAAIPLALLLCKKKQWLCFKTKTTPTPKRPLPVQDSGQTINMKYNRISNSVKPEKTSTYAGPLFGPQPPTLPSNSVPNKTEIKESPIKPTGPHTIRRKPQQEWMPERAMTPIENPVP